MKEMYKGIAFSPNAMLTKAIGATDTVIEVDDITVFPEGPNLATIGTDEFGETIFYAQKVDSKLSGCVRGFEGTAKAWQVNEVVARNFTNKDFQSLIDNIDILNTKKVERVNGKGLSTNDYDNIEKKKNEDNKKDISNLAGPGRTTETVKGNADNIHSHKNKQVHSHEIHGFRLNEDSKLEYFDGTEWVELKGGGDEISVAGVSDFAGASSGNGTSANLSWINPSNPEYLRTEIYASDVDITDSKLDFVIANSTLVVDSDTLTSYEHATSRDTLIYFKAYAVHSLFGTDRYSEAITISVLTKDTEAPGTITDFKVDKEDNTLIDLSWINPTDADFSKVKIVYKLGSYPTSHTDGTVAYEGSATTKSVAGLTNDVEHFFRAFTFDNSGNINSETINQQVVGMPSDGDDKTGSPGSKSLIAGDMTAGYFGVVPASELFTGAELAALCGITEGTAQFNEVGWLKFAIDGEIIFKSQKPYRHSISWDYIDSKGCVFGGKEVTKGSTNFKVTLIKGASSDPYLYADADRGAKGSEWNRLMLPIHIQAKDKSWAYPAYVEDDIPYWGIDFTDQDLHTHNSFGDGSYQWGQETPSDYAAYRVLRGYGGVSGSFRTTSSNTNATRGWSPVLRVIS